MSRDLNQVAIKGRLGKDAEIKQTKNGKSVASFSIANNRDWGSSDAEKKTNWINCRAYGKTAENIAKYFHKGDSIIISGEIFADSWDDNGTTKYFTGVLVSGFDFCGNKSQSNSNTVSEPVNDISSEMDGPDFI